MHDPAASCRSCLLRHLSCAVRQEGFSPDTQPRHLSPLSTGLEHTTCPTVGGRTLLHTNRHKKRDREPRAGSPAPSRAVSGEGAWEGAALRSRSWSQFAGLSWTHQH